MENNEFLIDPHHRGNLMDDEDHSQLGKLSSVPAPTANNNLLFGDVPPPSFNEAAASAAAAADGTFLVDELDDDDRHSQHDHHYHHSASAVELGDDDIRQQHRPPSEDNIGGGSQRSSSTDDFEFIATPPSTTAAAANTDVKMDNLLDIDSSSEPGRVQASVTLNPTTANLVETLMTASDLDMGPSSRNSNNNAGGDRLVGAADAFLGNEFTHFSSKPMKDVYSDFMEAERGGRVDFQPERIETVTAADPLPIIDQHRQVEAPVKLNKPAVVDSDEDDDLLEQFSAPVAAVDPVIKSAVAAAAVAEEKKFMMEEPKVVPIPMKKEEEPKKPIEVEVSKPSVVAAAAPPVVAVQKKPAAPSSKDELITTSAEEMFCKFGLDAWFKPERLHPKVESLIYWRDVKKSGIVFGAGLLILLAMCCFSVISVFAYVSLLTLAGTVAFRIYKSVMQAIQKTSDGHPFKAFLDFELQLPQEKVQQVTGVAVSHINSVLAELRRLFLVEDLIDSIKFGLMLWCLTYVGAWFNGMTLVILSYVALFTLPKVYEANKTEIDTYLDLVRSKINEITEKVKAAIPIGKKAESDKEK